MQTVSDSSVTDGQFNAQRPGTLARVGANVAAAVSVLAGKALIGLGLRRPPEGWRRTVGVLLRSESTRFALSAFGLRVPAGADAIETRVARGLLSYLEKEPDAHFALEWRPHVTIRRSVPYVDVVLLRFADGVLKSMAPNLSDRGPAVPAPEVRERVHDAVVAAYKRTARLPAIQRPQHL